MEHITLIHWLLAFGGAIVAVLEKIFEMQQQPGYRFGGYLKKYWISLIATLISIPIIMLVISDTGLRELLPINNLTAAVCGYQTQDFFKKLVNVGKAMYDKNAAAI